MLMETSTKENGKMVKLMVTEYGPRRVMSKAGASQSPKRFRLDVPMMVMTASVTVSFTILRKSSMADLKNRMMTNASGKLNQIFVGFIFDFDFS